MPTYLWGFSGGWWHALTRHDPDFTAVTELHVSEKLTAARRRKDPEAEAVKHPVVVGKPGPGHGDTLCGIPKLALDRLGVDPDEGDRLCPACQAKTAAT